MKTQRIFNERARLKNLKSWESSVKVFGQASADEYFARDEAQRVAGAAQFGRASSLKTKRKDGDNHGSED
jgi:hypothetical protein